MSGRGRRGRGRPPKTPSLSTRGRGKSNFLKKPTRSQTVAGDQSDSRCSTPVSTTSSTPGLRSSARLGGRGRPRHAAEKSRSFVSKVVYDDDDEDPLADLDDNTSDLDEVADDDNVSLDSFDDNISDWSDDSAGSTSKKRPYFYSRRPKTPEFIDEKDIPPLVLPTSSTDLLVEGELLLKVISIYEVLRHFRHILRLSPFRFEDFCTALVCDEQCSLLADTHIQLLKAIMREEDANNTTFGPQDLKDSINVGAFFIDSMTWYELVRSYLDSDKSAEYKLAIPALEKSDYCSTTVEDRLTILQCLTNLFLATGPARDILMSEGNITYDNHCRNCHK